MTERRKHRATGNPVGRPRKEQVAASTPDTTVRRYGPESLTEDEVLELEQPIIRQDFTQMNEQQLRAFAYEHYGRQFPEGESFETIRNDVKMRTGMNLYQRYA